MHGWDFSQHGRSVHGDSCHGNSAEPASLLQAVCGSSAAADVLQEWDTVSTFAVAAIYNCTACKDWALFDHWRKKMMHATLPESQ